jgi:hypothetical protein
VHEKKHLKFFSSTTRLNSCPFLRHFEEHEGILFIYACRPRLYRLQEFSQKVNILIPNDTAVDFKAIKLGLGKCILPFTFSLLGHSG